MQDVSKQMFYESPNKCLAYRLHHFTSVLTEVTEAHYKKLDSLYASFSMRYLTSRPSLRISLHFQ